MGTALIASGLSAYFVYGGFQRRRIHPDRRRRAVQTEAETERRNKKSSNLRLDLKAKFVPGQPSDLAGMHLVYINSCWQLEQKFS